MAQDKNASKTVDIVLPGARKATGEPIYGIFDTVSGQFSKISLIKRVDGKVTRELVLLGKGAQSPGEAIKEFTAGAIMAAVGGRGDAPDGLCLWVAQCHSNAGLKPLMGYEVVAHSSGRGGTYRATMAQLVNVARAKAIFIGPSIEEFPRVRATRATKEKVTAETVDFLL